MQERQEERRKPIERLGDETIQCIAAGEVVENVASIVKELIENAVDAEAKNVVIETVGAGQEKLASHDDGFGILEEELELAVVRHATSKIRKSEELFALKTLGFRGEALAAIASVSKMTLTSKAKGRSQGAKLRLAAGVKEEALVAARATGTSVEIESLFFNLPARKAFQKSQLIENKEVRRVLLQAALTFPKLGIEWVSEGKKVLQIAPEMALQERFAFAIGRDLASSLIEVEESSPPFKAAGFISQASEHRPNRKGQFLSINSRAVEVALIQEAIEEAYQFRLPPNRFPLFAIHLELPENWIDVNIHPQKRVIQIAHEREVRSFILNLVRRALERGVRKAAPAPSPPELHPREPLATFSAPIFIQPHAYALDLPEEEPNLSLRFEGCKPLALGEVFLFQEPSGELLFLHTGHALERILFEEIEEKESLEAQGLLLAEIVELSFEEDALYLENQPLVQKMGLSLRPFGLRTYLLEAAPEGIETAASFREFLSEIAQRLEAGKDRNRRIAQFLRERRKVTLESAPYLLKRLFQTRLPEISPRGRPTFIRYTKEEVAKWF